MKNSSITTKHGCENSLGTRQSWGQAPFQLDSSTLLHAVCSAQLWWDMFGVSAPARETGFGGKGKCAPRARRELTKTEVSTSGPDWSVLMQIRTPNSHSLIGPKGTALISQNEATLVSEEADGDVAVHQLDCESL